MISDPVATIYKCFHPFTAWNSNVWAQLWCARSWVRGRPKIWEAENSPIGIEYMLWCKLLLIWINCNSQNVIFDLRLIQMCMGQRTALDSMENSWFILLLVTEAQQNYLFSLKSMASIVLCAKDHKKRWKSVVIPTSYLTALNHYLENWWNSQFKALWRLYWSVSPSVRFLAGKDLQMQLPDDH